MDEAITVERVRDVLVVGRMDRDGAAVVRAANLRPTRGRTYVVVGGSALDAVRGLDPWVVGDIEESTSGDLCVVAPRLGAGSADGTPPPARLLAERLGVEITAPTGSPVGLADGSLFVPGRTAGWVSYKPDGRVDRIGARLPAPWWQAGLPETTGQLAQIPAGLWLRRPPATDRPDDPLATVVPDLDRMYVVLGAPGELPPATAAVVEVLRSLPDEGRDRAVLVCYGCGPASALAQQVADTLGAPVRVAHGVPGEGGPRYVDRAGTPRWRPFAVESVYRPGQVPTLDRWTAPPGLPLIEPGSYRLAEGWRVDVVPRGLAVHPDSTALDRTMLAAGTGPTADIVVAAGGHFPDEVRAAFDRLIRELPADDRKNLRVLPIDQPTADAIATIEAAHTITSMPSMVDRGVRSVSTTPAPLAPPAGAVMITADGRIRPVGAILPSAVAAPAEETSPHAVGSAAGPRTHAPAAAVGTGMPGSPNRTANRPGTRERARRAGGTGAPAPVRGGVFRDAPNGGGHVVGRAEPAAVEELPPVEVRSVDQPAVTVADADRAAGPVARPELARLGIGRPGPARRAESVTGLLPGREPPRSMPPAEVAPAATRPAARPVPEPTALAVVERTVEPPVPPNVRAPVERPAEDVSAGTGTNAEPAPAEPPRGRDVRQEVVAVPVEVPEGVRSTLTQRRAMRERLGTRYDVATRVVTKLLSERPGLRFGTGDRAALLAELAVVRAFADDPTAQYDADFYVCLADGLLRLPTARAVVVRGIPADAAVTPSSVLRLPAPVIAAPAIAPTVGPAEALIWTTTGRRLDGLQDEPTGEIVLPGHTRLRVLAVEREPLHRVLLAEDGAAPDAALARLRAAATKRTAEPGTATTRWFGPLPAA
ncbi:hypothetical protein [Actinophytocola xanthii]|uniref:Uncharacterized protein n=1 Tax=Actinophytocola xanthii TaxID=1912961 RepID=A0A1Q8CTF6_9PSEU|nr:hypothetical protein [Actinophytocola xanthii]OLF17641.1 hypothetical protein BU204_10515 [Actinophytocola xanthii]